MMVISHSRRFVPGWKVAARAARARRCPGPGPRHPTGCEPAASPGRKGRSRKSENHVLGLHVAPELGNGCATPNPPAMPLLIRRFARVVPVLHKLCNRLAATRACGPHTAVPVAEPDDQGPGAPRWSGPTPEPAGAFLLVVGRDAYATYDLPAAGALTIGRGETNAVRIDDPLASRAHACLHVGEAMYLEDVGSVNGTRVKDRVVKPGERVRDHDRRDDPDRVVGADRPAPHRRRPI